MQLPEHRYNETQIVTYSGAFHIRWLFECSSVGVEADNCGKKSDYIQCNSFQRNQIIN
jgi:hypothetical protein